MLGVWRCLHGGVVGDRRSSLQVIYRFIVVTEGKYFRVLDAQG